jgi:thiol-disulfide isomerase/thioredoxin
MKNKILLFIIIVTMLFSAGCGSKDNQTDNIQGENSQSDNIQNENDKVNEVESNDDEKFSVGGFESQSIDGNLVDNSIFEDYDLTLVNIWATFCPPCLEEIPYLQEIYSSNKYEGFNIVGICSDIMMNDEIQQDNLDLAKEIIAENNVTYLNIILNEEVYNSIPVNLQYVPTTIFVDSEGNIVGDGEIGGHTKDEWEEIIEERLNHVKDTK